MNITIDIPDVATIVLPAALYRAEIERERHAAAESANTEANRLRAILDAIEDALPIAAETVLAGVQAMLAEMKELEASNEAQANTIKELAAKLEALEEPPVKPDDTVPDTVPIITIPDPVVVVPPSVPEVPPISTPPLPAVKLPAPTFAPDKVDNMYGIFISDGMASGNRRDAWLAEVIDFIIDAKVFNTVYMFANIQELGGWSAQSMSPAMRLRLNKIAWVYDTWNSLPHTVYDQAAFAIKALGGVAIEIDDAHRWLPDTGNAVQDKDRMDQMRGMVGGASRANLPVIASYGGKTDIKVHSSMKLVIARQAYVNGENPKLVRSYLTPDTHIANLGAYKPDKDSPMTTPAEVRGAFDAFRDSPVKGLAWYGFDDGTDLRKFPAQWAEIVKAGKVYWKDRGIDLG